MAQLLSESVALVTGGSSGIGRKIATTFAEEGADVTVADIQSEPRLGGRPTHKLITEETDAGAQFVECDVTSPNDLESAVDQTERFGELDVMVNNAGQAQSDDFLETTPKQYQGLMAVNAQGVYFGSQAAARRMVKHGGGKIVNISSTAGIMGARSSVSYSASKGAVRVMTYSIAANLGSRGIKANVIHPGTIETSMTVKDNDRLNPDDEEYMEEFTSDIPSSRIGKPQDIANTALFLASDLSSYVNAESIIVDGGRSNTQG